MSELTDAEDAATAALATWRTASVTYDAARAAAAAATTAYNAAYSVCAKARANAKGGDR